MLLEVLYSDEHRGFCSPPHLHRERPARNADYRTVVEVTGELVTVDGGTHQDQPQVRPPHNHVLQNGEQEVRLDATLMDLSKMEGQRE